MLEKDKCISYWNLKYAKSRKENYYKNCRDIIYRISFFSGWDHRYFKKLAFSTSGMIVFLFALLFIFISKNSGDLQRDLIEKLLRSPISHSFIVINKSFDQTKAKLESNGIMMGESNTIEEISIKNQISPQEIIELIMQ